MTTAGAEPRSRRGSCSQRGTIVHIFTHLPQFRITVFISKFVELHGVLSFQNKHICQVIYGPQCESLMSHLQVKINEAAIMFSFNAA